MVDTGFYKNVLLSNTIAGKYGINIKDGNETGYGHSDSSSNPAYTLIADTVKAGHSVLANMEIEFAVNKNSFDSNSEFIGLLGNGFLENFDVVFDLKNYYLYLRPLN